jgi:hypothetical protein
MPRRKEPPPIQLPTTLEEMNNIAASSMAILTELRNLEELVRARSAGMIEVMRAFQMKVIPLSGQILEVRNQYERAVQQAVLLGKEEKPTLEEFIAERAEEGKMSDILHDQKEPRKILSDGDEDASS